MSTPDRDTSRSFFLTSRLRRCLLVALIGTSGTVVTRAHAVSLDPSPDGIRTVSVGDGSTCAVTLGGDVKCWGAGDLGQLGYGNTQTIGDDELPSAVGFVDVGAPVLDVRTNGRQTFALLASGVVRAWGDDGAYELGLRHTTTIGDDETPATASVPVDVELSGLAVEIAVGDDFACARLEQGAVQCWGSNEWGQLGRGHTQRIGDDESPASAGTVALVGPALSIAAGAHHACALLDDGEIQCWGRGTEGQLGYGNTDHIGDDELPSLWGTVPLDAEVVEITAGEAHTCARLQSGGVRCWGANDAGQLGLGHTERIGDDELLDSVAAVRLGGPAVSVEAGARHTCAILEGGSLRCWGEGLDGRLGLGDVADIGDDELPTHVGTIDLGERLIVDIFLGPTASSTCALLDDGALRCWGLDDVGQLGYGDVETRGDGSSTRPVRVPDVIVIDDSED